MSVPVRLNRITAPDVLGRKAGEKLVVLTAYHAQSARMADPHCDVLLVGDSLGNVLYGFDTTLPVTLDMMIMHGRAVVAASRRALVVVDMPFASYEVSKEQAFASAARVMQETGCGAVKLEGGVHFAETIAFLVARGIPVMGHVGLRPQAVLTEGSFKAKGKTDDERLRVIAEAEATADAGAFAVVIEGTAEAVAAEITAVIDKPTIGIGASAACDGQILVTPDMLGLFDWTPKFVRKYADLRTEIDRAVGQYASDVKARRFPAEVETYFSKKPVKS